MIAKDGREGVIEDTGMIRQKIHREGVNGRKYYSKNLKFLLGTDQNLSGTRAGSIERGAKTFF